MKPDSDVLKCNCNLAADNHESFCSWSFIIQRIDLIYSILNNLHCNFLTTVHRMTNNGNIAILLQYVCCVDVSFMILCYLELPVKLSC